MYAIEKMEKKVERREKKKQKPKVAMHGKNLATVIRNSIANSKGKGIDNSGLAW